MKAKKYYWGAMFIAAGLLLILYYTGVIEGISIFSAVFSVLLIPIIISSAIKRNFAGIMFPLAIIVILFDDVLGLEKFTPWPALFTALFLSIGFTILFPKNGSWYNSKTKNSAHFGGVGGFDSTSEDESVININTRCNGVTRYIRSKNLKEVNINVSCAGAKIYFDNADIAGNEAVVNINSTAAGISLYVPCHWHIKNELKTGLGGYTESGKPESDVTTKTLVLAGSCGASGIKIVRI